MLQWKMAWREMRAHPGRALLTWLSVVIGVAAVLAIGLSTGSARRAFQQMYQTITGRAALEVTAAGSMTLDMALLETVRSVPGVEVAVPLVQRNTIMYYDGGRAKLVVLGIDPALDAQVRDYELVAGQPLSEAAGVMLDASLASSLGLEPGDQVRLLVRRGRITTRIVGLVRPRTGAGVASGGVLFMRLSTAQRRFGIPGRVDRIQVVLNEDADEEAVEAVRAELARRLPDDVQLQAPTTHSALAEETMWALENGLQLATGFSLLAAVFIIMNTFMMSVGQRRRYLAVMRAIGASRQQISGLVFRESVLLGVLGTIAGTGLGFVGAQGINHAMSDLFRTSLPAVQLRPWPLVVAAAFGLGVSIAGALVPGRRAARVTPLEGMAGTAPGEFESNQRRLVTVAGIALILSTLLFVAVLTGRIHYRHTVSITLALLISLVLLLPLVLRPLTWIGQQLLRPLGSVESRLARRQLLLHKGRTTLTVAVLFVSVAAGLGLANTVVNNVEDVRRWYRTAIVGDFFVRASNPDVELGQSAPVPEGVDQQLLEIDGIESIEMLRFVSAEANGQQVIIVVQGPIDGSDTAPDNGETAQADSTQDGARSAGAPDATARPTAGSVDLGSVLALRLGVEQGDSITIPTQQGEAHFRVRKIVNDYLAGGLTVHMERSLAQRLLGVEGADAYIVKADHARLDQVRTELARLCEQHGLLLQSYADLTQMIESMMGGVVASLWGLLVLGLVVAAFGVVNTLGMNVLEQTREFGLLRVVAMTRDQVRRVIVAQAGMLGLLGVVPGILAGMLMAYMMNLSVAPVVGHPVEFVLKFDLMITGLVVAMLVVLLAAWVPAERAARLPLATALRYE